MNGKLITFEEVRHIQEIDLIGGCVEIDLQKIIYRGQLDDILWWNNYPRKIKWLNSLEWWPNSTSWTPGKVINVSLEFCFNSVELFYGPFELDSEEIFFILAGKMAVTIFPNRCEPPEVPKGDDRYKLLCKHFQ